MKANNINSLIAKLVKEQEQISKKFKAACDVMNSYRSKTTAEFFSLSIEEQQKFSTANSDFYKYDAQISALTDTIEKLTRVFSQD